MSERYDNTTPDLRSESRDPTQGQGQFNLDPTNRDPYFARPDIRGEGRGSTQGQGQGEFDDDPTTRSSQFGSRPGGDPSQATSQSADPDFDRHDPSRSESYDQTRPSGTGGQDYSQHGQRRQGGQTASDRVPLRAGQERFEPSGNYGISRGTVPEPRPGGYEIHGDGGFSAKPSMHERVVGTTEKMIGKATGNVRMYERGEEHKTGGR
jgi:hypothetical protein